MKLRQSLLQIVFCVAVIGVVVSACVAAQDEDNNSFTGTLIENAPDHLKVTRVMQGKTEGRVFKVTAQTKIEGGRLRLKQRIYVRYITGDDSDIAILVIIRPAAKKTK